MIPLVDQQSRTEADGGTVMTFSVRIPSREKIGGPREAEMAVQQALHKAGGQIMETVLARYDTDGEPIERSGVWYTSKGRQEETYQSVFAPCTVMRHVYQNGEGGKTWCPLEERARIIENATCQFAAIIAAKYSALSGRGTVRDLERSLQRRVSLARVQTVAGHLGEVAVRKEPHWAYAVDTPREQVEAFAMGIDGTCVAICEEGYKQVMAGTIALLDGKGERLETIYVANAPEEGKATFLARMEREVERLKAWDPEAPWQGVCDGAPDLQAWLEKHCDMVTLDFYHVSEYVSAASAAFGEDAAAHQAWLRETLHDLKHGDRAAEKLLRRLRKRLRDPELPAALRGEVEKARHYIETNLDRMDYAALRGAGLLIGSGITEAACKHIVKERVCGSGMRWKRKALQSVLSLRALTESSSRWEQFWSRIERFGY